MNSEELKAHIAEIKANLAKAQEALAPIEKIKQDLKNDERIAYEAYQAAVANARKQQKQLDEAAFEFQSRANSLKWELQAKENEFLQMQQAEEAELREAERKEAFAKIADSWNQATMGAPWREWAKDHQIDAGHYITEHRNVILADPMGLGKTLSSIIACDIVEAASRNASPEEPFLGEVVNKYDYQTGEYKDVIEGAITRPVGKRVLYFCPSSLIRNVQKEFRMWAKHRSVVFVGGMTKAERGFLFDTVLKGQPEFVVICNYEAWRKDKSLIQSLINLDPDMVIIDEAHNIKDMKTSGFKGIQTIIQQAKPAYVIPMTGTPILNRPQELFSLLNLVNPTDFYRLNDFLFTYCEQDEAGYWKFQPGGLDRIAKRIRKNFLRRTRDQAGIELPEKTIINHDLEVDVQTYAEQAKARENMRKYATIMVDETKGQAITAAAAIAMFTRLRQIETWPAGIEMKDAITGEIKFALNVEESQKLDYVISNGPDENGDWTGLIPEAISDERMVLFSQFKAPLYEIKRRVEQMGYRPVVLDGSVSADDREAIANDFDMRYTPDRANSRYDIVLCNYRVGGVGINLTAATQLIALDEEWNWGKQEQAFDRIHRIGQEKPVTIHVIRTQKTIDDWLAGIVEAKKNLSEGFENHMSLMKEFKEFLDESGLM